MALVAQAGYYARFALPLLLAAGCGLSKPAVRPATPGGVAPATVQAIRPPIVDGPAGPVVQVMHRLPIAEPSLEVDGDIRLSNQAELSLDELINQVEVRNPSVQAMIYAWQAMAQRYPQAISLDDPMFMAMAAPASFSSSQVESAYVLQGSQKVPWFGKRPTRGQAAQSEASAAYHDISDTRLQVAQVTRIAFYDYCLVEREAELVEQNSQVMTAFRDAARVKYENNQVTQQDVVQGDVELAEIARRRIEIERARHVAAARINTLLRRPPMAPLPPPPRHLVFDSGPPPIEALQQQAAVQRPDLSALAARVRAEEAAVNLALKQYYPDAEFFGRYDSFWQPAATQSDLRAQVGMNMNVPIYRRKLQAAVCEAQFRLSQRRAEYEQRQLDISYQVQAAYEQVQESRRLAQLYADSYLQLADQNVAAARSNYDVGKVNFQTLAQAQRQSIDAQEKYQQTLAEYHRRRAELDRAIGGSRPIATGQPEMLPLPKSQ